MADKGFNEWLLASAPAPFNGTEQYRRFVQIAFIISLILMIVFAYGVCLFYPITEDMAITILKYLPFLESRGNFLKTHDIQSYFTYVATVISILITFPVVLLFFSVGYWRTVVLRRKCRSVSKDTLLAMMYVTFGSVILLLGTFISVPASFDARWPGSAWILFWPSFPIIGVGIAICSSLLLWTVLVRIVQVAFLRGGHDA